MGVDIGRVVGTETEDDGHTYSVTEDDVSFSYGGFASFRRDLAQAVGIYLDSMQGFKRDGPRTSWSVINHPLVPFLNHSDCDGELTPEEAAQVWPALVAAADAGFPDLDDGDLMTKRCRELAETLRLAAEHEQTVVFR